MINEKNEKLLKIIDEAITSSSSSVEALDKILKYKKENEGLIGMNFSIYPISEDGTIDNEKAAKNLITMMRCSANGEYEDITCTEL